MAAHPKFADRILLLAILLIALGVRVHRLDGQSLWYDEAVTAQVSARGIAELTRWTADDIQPPLYYYIVAGWTRLAGRSEWALRFPSAFFSLLTVALLWTLARRLFWPGRARRIAAVAAALLAAVSPLHVYYAQEARMYAQLTFLAALAGYALLRAAASRGTTSQGVGWWLAFVLTATSMLYTHYFGVFLLLAYGFCWLVHAARAGGLSRWRALAALALAALAIVVLYLPWLPAMLNRYQVDRSYWRGNLKLVEALRHVAINLTVGAPETILEPDALRLLPWFAVAVILAVLAVLWRGSRRAGERGSIGSLACLFVCLVVPVLLALIIASRTPKFNARYLMMVSPAYLLILAGGMGYGVLGIGYWAGRYASPNGRRLMSVAVFVVLIAFPMATSAAGLRNWFTDPAFTKAQWRELTGVVRAQIAADEAALLVSGHAWPAWDYYAPDIPVVRLPNIDILDVNAVLDLGVGSEIGHALAGKSGVWLVLWQAEVVDPVGVVPYLLERAGREQPVGQQFWHLRLRHWRLPPDATYPTEPQPQHSDGANFGHKIALLGWDDPQGGRITVYWGALHTLLRDYQVSLVLEDVTGVELGRWDGRPAGYDYPAFRWQPGQVLFGRYPLPLPKGVQADQVYVTLAVYDPADPTGLDIMDVADNPAGKRVRLGPMPIER